MEQNCAPPGAIEDKTSNSDTPLGAILPTTVDLTPDPIPSQNATLVDRAGPTTVVLAFPGSPAIDAGTHAHSDIVTRFACAMGDFDRECQAHTTELEAFERAIDDTQVALDTYKAATRHKSRHRAARRRVLGRTARDFFAKYKTYQAANDALGAIETRLFNALWAVHGLLMFLADSPDTDTGVVLDAVEAYNRAYNRAYHRLLLAYTAALDGSDRMRYLMDGAPLEEMMRDVPENHWEREREGHL